MVIEKDLIKELGIEEALAQPQPQENVWINQEVLVIVLKINSFSGKENAYNMMLAGKKMFEWVEMAVSGTRVKEVVADARANVLDVIRPHLESGYKWTAVLYSDTPLLEKSTFVEIMEYVQLKKPNALKLIRGYVFNTEYAKTATEVLQSAMETFNRENFLVVNNAENMNIAARTLYNRILEYHISNGVIILDKLSVFIDANVVIDSGATLEPFTRLTGECYIGKNAIIGSFTHLHSCVVEDGANVRSLYEENKKFS